MVNGKENFSLETVTFCPHPVAASLYTGRERGLLHSARTQWPLRYTLGASGIIFRHVWFFLRIQVIRNGMICIQPANYYNFVGLGNINCRFPGFITISRMDSIRLETKISIKVKYRGWQSGIAFLIANLLFISCAPKYVKNYHLVLKSGESEESMNVNRRSIRYEKRAIKRRIEAIGARHPEIKWNSAHKTFDIRFYIPDKDTSGLKSLFETRGKLVFYQTYCLLDIAEFLYKADKALYKKNLKSKADTSSNPFFTALDTRHFADSTNCRGAAIGRAKASDTLKIRAILNDTVIKKLLPADISFEWSYNKEFGNDYCDLYALKTGKTETDEIINGEVIKGAKTIYSGITRGFVVDITMDNKGTNEWKLMTKRNIGRIIAISVDDKVYAAPYIINEISHGESQISSNFSKDQAEKLANIIQSHNLISPLRIVKSEFIKQ